MADTNGDGVWKFTATLSTAGNCEYKIVEDGGWGQPSNEPVSRP
jgi:hypothetical protein